MIIPKKQIKILIVEDDIDSAKLIELYLNKYFKEQKAIFIAHTLQDAFETFFEHKPELLFLDVRIGNDTVFTFLEKIKNYDVFKIFITSHNEYAIKAIDYGVLSYLLKPILIEKFIDVTLKALLKIAAIDEQKTSNNMQPIKSFIAISSLEKVEIVDKSSIIYLEADGRYTKFYLKDSTLKIATVNLGEYEELLGQNFFIRIHHKYIINIREVLKIEKSLGYDCLMSNHKLLPVSKRKVNDLINFLNLKKV